MDIVIIGIVVIVIVIIALAGGSVARGTVDLSMHAAMQAIEQNIIRAARAARVDPALLAGLVFRESSGNPLAQGGAGEIGLGQLKPIAMRDLNNLGLSPREKPTFDIDDNLADTAQFLALQIRRAGNVYDGLRAYNQGYFGSSTNPMLGANYANRVISTAKMYGYKGNN